MSVPFYVRPFVRDLFSSGFLKGTHLLRHNSGLVLIFFLNK